MKSVKKLYDDLLVAHHAGLIHVVSVESFPIKFEVAFSHTVIPAAQWKLYKHIRDIYRVQLWWSGSNVLTIQELRTDCLSRIGYCPKVSR